MESSLIAKSATWRSKKRVFPQGSSIDPDVVEIPPPADRSFKPKALAITEVTNQEIIDVDVDENHGNIYIEAKADNKHKGKRAAMINTLVAHSTSNGGSVYADQSSKKTSAPGSHNIINLNGFGSDLSYLDGNYVGVEAPVSWFPGPAQNRRTLATTESSNDTILKLQLSPKSFLPGLEASHSLWSVEPPERKSTTSSSIMETPVHAVDYPHKKGPSSMWSAAENGQRSGWPYNNKATFSGDASIQGPHNPAGFIEQYHQFAPTYGPAGFFEKYNPAGFSANFNSNTKKTVGGYSFLSGPSMHNSLEAYSVIPNWFNLDNNVFPIDSLEAGYEPFVQNQFTIQNSASALGIPYGSSFKIQRNAKDLWTPSGSSSNKEESDAPKHVNEDDILKKFQQFKKFDIVEDPSDNHYVNKGTSAKQPSKSWSKKIQEEWKILEKDLPDTIFVRAYDTRMDLLRAVIVGADGTPYHDGLYFFDVFFPDSYPNVPPLVYYHSRGLRLNPNLYPDGKVCLSLLNTWPGSHIEKWIPKSSTMLQVLVSLQGLILNAKPYFNEPVFAHSSGTQSGEENSQQYNETIFILSLKTMVFTLRKQPTHFEDFVVGHFFKRAREILVACKAYMDGAQVGCLVSGGIQDVDEGDKSCSKQFRLSLSGCIKEVVKAFTGIGVKDCTQFIPAAKTGNMQT